MPAPPGVTRRALVAAALAAPLASSLATLFAPPAAAHGGTPTGPRLESWPLRTPSATGIHDVAPAPDGGVWFSAQRSGHLGWFDPKTAKAELVALGAGASPHGVIQGPDGAAWLTDGGQNAIVRVAWPSREVTVFRLPEGTSYANLNTCAFDRDGDLWFTGQNGYVGKVAVKTGEVRVKAAPKGMGPYGICATPAGEIWWCSLAGSFIARIDRATGESIVVEPPTPGQGARRVWSDSRGRIWVAEWYSGNLSMHDPSNGRWFVRKMPGESPKPYAVYVDEADRVWVSDWATHSVMVFDAGGSLMGAVPTQRGAGIRQILGRPGEVWLPESGTESIAVIRTA